MAHLECCVRLLSLWFSNWQSMTVLSTTEPAILIKAGKAHFTQWLKLMPKAPSLPTKQHCSKQHSPITADAGGKGGGVERPEKAAVWNQAFSSPEAGVNSIMCANICAHCSWIPKFCQIRHSVSACSTSIYAAHNVRRYLKWQARCSSSVVCSRLSLWARQVWETLRREARPMNGTMRSQEHASSGPLVILLKSARHPTWVMAKARETEMKEKGDYDSAHKTAESAAACSEHCKLRASLGTTLLGTPNFGYWP